MKTRLILIVALLELSVFLFVAIALQHSREEHESHALVTTQNLAKLLSFDLASTFDGIDLVLFALKDEVERQLSAGDVGLSNLGAVMERNASRNPNVSVTVFTDKNGQAVYWTGVPERGAPSFEDRDYFIRLKSDAKSDLIISKPVLDRLSGKWQIVFARRVNKPDGAFAGVVQATVALEHLQKLFITLNLGPRGVVSLRDGNLSTVSRYPDTNPTSTGSTTVSNEWKEKLKENPVFGTYFAVGLDQIGRAISYHKIGDYPHFIVVALYPPDFLEPWFRELRNTLVLAIVCAVTIFLFAWSIARTWRNKVAEITRMAEMSRRVVEAQDSERRSLALALHDVASPDLAAMRIHLGMIQSDLPSPLGQKFEPRFALVRKLLDGITRHLRDLGAILCPTMIEYSGLLPAIEDYAKNVWVGVPMKVTATGIARNKRLPPELEYLLFRIVQEAVTNAAKHAQASSIEIELNFEVGRTHLTILDDGIGFDPAGVGKGGRPGLGLVTMRVRAESAGGRYSVYSSPGRGTRISVEI